MRTKEQRMKYGRYLKGKTYEEVFGANKAKEINKPVSLENKIFHWPFVIDKYIKTANYIINIYQKTNKTKIKTNYQIIAEFINDRKCEKMQLSFENLGINYINAKLYLFETNSVIEI